MSTRGASRFSPGEEVQTTFGRGIVREIRPRRRLVVEVQGRAVVTAETEVSAIGTSRAGSRRRQSVPPRAPLAARDDSPPGRKQVEIDLHRLTVDQALTRVDEALNGAALDDVSTVRFVHGQGGGRIRAALHRRLREISSVRAFRLDPRNAGVTIVTL